MDKQRLHAIRERAEKATKGPWEAPLINLGKVESFKAVDFYFDNSYEAYPPLGESGPVFVANSKENADFIAHAREDIPHLLKLVAGLSTELKCYLISSGHPYYDCTEECIICQIIRNVADLLGECQ